MAKLYEVKGGNGDTGLRIAGQGDSTPIVQDGVQPGTTAKPDRERDVNEAVRPEPGTLTEQARTQAYDRLKDAEQIAAVLQTAVEDFSTPVMPEHVGLSLVKHLGVPVPGELETELTQSADAKIEALGDVSNIAIA